MTGLNLFPIFMVGLLGSVHCVGMCGGIVGALSVVAVPKRQFLIAVVERSDSMLKASIFENTLRVFFYNAGRLSSYTVAGALVGGFAGSVRTLIGFSAVQSAGYWLVNVMLVALGLYLMDVWRGLAKLEAAGQLIWRQVQPLMKYLMPLDSPFKMLIAGGLWGWLPCGMVYSMLLTAMLSGSALSGATVMLVFGLGTMPMLFVMGIIGSKIKNWIQRRPIRLMSGLIVVAFGLLGLMRAANGIPVGLLDSFCLTSVSNSWLP